MGGFGRGGTCGQISFYCSRLGPGLRLLLSDRARGRVAVIEPITAGGRRHPESYRVTLGEPADVAAHYRKLFGPSAVPKKFEGFPEEMAVRPSQIRASAAETALLIPSALALQSAYATLKMPIAIIAGAADRIIEIEQSAELHRAISQSTLRCIPGNGHMVHQTATAEIMSAIDMVASQDVSDKVSAAA